MSSKLKIEVVNLENKVLEDIFLSDIIFNAKENKEIVARLVNWQLAKKLSLIHI